MRVASRIIGGILLFCGICFAGLAIFLFIAETQARFVGLIPLAFGVGLLFAGRYFLRLDVDTPDEEEEQEPQNRFAPFVAAHRRELRVLAQVGLALCMVRIIVLCFGSDWSVWSRWALTIGCVGLLLISPKMSKPAPKWARYISTVWQCGLLLFVASFAWSHWSHRPSPLPQKGVEIMGSGVLALLYASEALAFACGEIQPLNVDSVE